MKKYNQNKLKTLYSRLIVDLQCSASIKIIIIKKSKNRPDLIMALRKCHYEVCMMNYSYQKMHFFLAINLVLKSVKSRVAFRRFGVIMSEENP